MPEHTLKTSPASCMMNDNDSCTIEGMSGSSPFRTEVPRKSPDPLEKVVVLDRLFLERSGCRLIAAEMGTEATGSFTQQCRVWRDRSETLTDEAAA